MSEEIRNVGRIETLLRSSSENLVDRSLLSALDGREAKEEDVIRRNWETNAGGA